MSFTSAISLIFWPLPTGGWKSSVSSALGSATVNFCVERRTRLPLTVVAVMSCAGTCSSSEASAVGSGCCSASLMLAGLSGLCSRAFVLLYAILEAGLESNTYLQK